MKLYLFITCVPLFLFLKSLIKPLSQWSTTTTTSETRLLSLPLFKDLIFPISNKNPPPKTMSSLKRKASTTITSSKKVESVVDDDENDVVSAALLDLPELALDCILEKLPPKSLCSMAGVCASMRERCLSDRLWERHVAQKWAGVAGEAAYREWQWQMATARPDHKKQANNKQKGLFRNFPSIGWPFSNWTTNSNVKPNRTPLRVDSLMAWYLSLETGKFCFPAQVYNRENGHVGFMLSCYDAKISYDPRTDTFQARYPPHGRRAMAVESGVPWERLRAPPVDTSPHDLHISDCLHELSPGDHIEIQWRRNKEFPYGWWYGVVGHLELCDGNEYHCRCHDSDTIVLEFNQYTPGSRWRHTAVNRKDHKEEGNEADGFYGGIRKLNDRREISTWKRLWPAETLD